VVRKAVRAHSRRHRRAPGQRGQIAAIDKRCYSLQRCRNGGDLQTF
jgi:hypothetical protein